MDGYALTAKPIVKDCAENAPNLFSSFMGSISVNYSPQVAAQTRHLIGANVQGALTR